MKDNVLKAAVTEAVEKLTKALRNYTDEPMNCFVSVFTRDSTLNPDDPDGVPDYYNAVIRSEYCEDKSDATLKLMCKIYYCEDEFEKESIRKVVPYCYEEEGDES